MSDALAVLLSFVAGCVVTYTLVKRTIGTRNWHDGYLQGFNYAWDEKAKSDEDERLKKLKQIRKKRPRFEIIEGDKK